MLSESQFIKVIKLIKAICSRVKEKEGYLNKTKLVKYLYLIDIEYFRRHNKTFTGFDWIFYDFGPWAYEYNEIIKKIENSPEFLISESRYNDLDTIFITCIEREDFESVFDDIDDQLKAKRIVDRWALENLNSLLNYVYFRTEPMMNAQRYEKLDFTKVHSMEPIPKFILSKGIKNLEEKKFVQKRIKERLLSLKKKSNQDATFTPPKYDEDFISNMERMKIDDEY